MGVIGVGSAILSAVEHFVDDDGVHTIRSLDFNVSSYADTFQESIDSFVVRAEDYCPI